MRILIGVAEHIDQNGEEKCGGVVGNQRKMLLVVNSVNMKLKMKMSSQMTSALRMIMIWMKMEKIA